MGKEITLSQLEAAAKPTKIVTPKVNNEQSKIINKSSGPTANSKVMDTTEMSARLKNAHGVAQEGPDEGEIPPVMDNAMKSMFETIERKKENYDRIKPIIEEKMKDQALNDELKELGIEDEDDEESSDTNDKSNESVKDHEEDTEDTDISDFNTEEDDADDDDYEVNDELDVYNFNTEDEEDEDEEESMEENNNNVKPNLDIDENDFKDLEEDENTVISEEEVEDDADDEDDEESVEEEPSEEIVKERPKKRKNIVATVSKKDVTTTEDNNASDLDKFMEDLDKEDSMNVVDDEEETPKEIRARLRKKLNNVNVTTKPIDFAKFTIRKEAISSSLILNTLSNNKSLKTATWPLIYSGRNMTFTECSGPELDTLRKNIGNGNDMNGVIETLKFIYNHTVDANKPKFESWCKLIRTEDVESMYYGIYKACYSDTNLIARVCQNEECKKTVLIDTDIDAMVKYRNDKVKKKFEDLKRMDSTTESNKFKSTLLQISDDLVISYSAPTLYSTFIQYSTLRSEITEKYGDILSTMAYIDGFYSIDRKTNQLIPIKIKDYPTNLNKTILARLKVYTDILKSLTSDQYVLMTSKLMTLGNPEEYDVTYVYPEEKCTECGSTIPEEPVQSMLNLLFLRAQLVQIKNS